MLIVKMPIILFISAIIAVVEVAIRSIWSPDTKCHGLGRGLPIGAAKAAGGGGVRR
jgi:hypothetical protein